MASARRHGSPAPAPSSMQRMARNRGRLELTRLGRQLRRLVGHNEGLHALIAHFSGELRPVA